MTRRERRAADPEVQAKREQFAAGIGGVNSGNGSQGGGGGYGIGEKGAMPTSGDRTRVSPFIIPKTVGLDQTSLYFPNNYIVNWDLTTVRYACDQCVKMGLPVAYAALTSWVFESSAFVQSLFKQLSVDIDQVPFFFKDSKGNQNDEWNEEITTKKFFKDICKEILLSQFWGFSALNIDWFTQKVYKYPMANIDPINRMIRQQTYNFSDGMRCAEHVNLLFIQPSSSYESFLGWMQPIARAFVQINQNKNNWLAAGSRLAWPIITAGYPQNDTAIDPVTGAGYNKSKYEADTILANLNPQKGISYPFTLAPDGTIQKAIDIEFINSGTSGKSAHMIFSDFNEKEKEEIMQLVLGGTLTAQVGSKGSLALGNIHMQKLEDMKRSNLELIKSIINDDLLKKIKQIYKNFPEELTIDYDLSKKWTLEEMAILSPILQANGMKLKGEAFASIGLPEEYIEDRPEPVMPDFQNESSPPEEKDKSKSKTLEMAIKGKFGLKKKVRS